MTEQMTDRHSKVRETITVVVLSLTAVLTAWSGFQSSKWGGEMSIAFSQASAQRIEASRHAASADAARAVDLDVFGIYLQAAAENDERLEQFARVRFTDHFDIAFRKWQAMKPLQNPSAPKSPFALDSYVPPGSLEAAESDSHADAKFQQALVDNQRGDNYALLTVLFALVLFFAAFAGRVRSRRTSWSLVGLASTFLVGGVVLLLAFPKIV